MSDKALISDDQTPLLGEDTEEGPLNTDIKWPSCRVMLALMAFMGFVNVYALRVNLSVAVVSMANASCLTPPTPINATNQTAPQCPKDNVTEVEVAHAEKFCWTEFQRGQILGAFFYGYIVTQIPGGWLASVVGGKWLYGLGILCTAVLTLVTPLAAHGGFGTLIAVRVLEGIGEGVTFPAMHAMLAQWSPPLERSKLGTFIYSGAQLGTVISMPISGLLCQYVGWPYVFYLFGALAIVWFIAWCFLAFDSPSKHPRISEAEKRYIEKSLQSSQKEKSMKTPWGSFLTSIPLWSLILAHFCNNWGYYTLLTSLPTYMGDVLGFNISQNGFLSAIPYLACWILMSLSGQVADFIRYRKILTTTWVRKWANAIAFLTPGVLLVVMAYIGCDRGLAVFLLTVSVGVSGVGMSGYGVNHLDIGPPFAGTLMGITNSVATIPGFVGPQVVGILTNQQNNREQWKKVFFISSAIYVFGAVQYMMFGSGTVQPWAVPKKKKVPTATLR